MTGSLHRTSDRVRLAATPHGIWLAHGRLVRPYSSLEVARLVVISIGQDLVGLLLLESMELDIDQPSDVIVLRCRDAEGLGSCLACGRASRAILIDDERGHDGS